MRDDRQLKLEQSRIDSSKVMSRLLKLEESKERRNKTKMAKHTARELQELQALSLEVKVSLTMDRIEEWVEHFGVDGVYISKVIEILETLEDDLHDDECYGEGSKEYEDTLTALAIAIDNLTDRVCEDCVVSKKAVIDAIHKQMFKFVDKAIDEQSEETDDKVDLLLTVNKDITGAIRSLPLAKAERICKEEKHNENRSN